MSVVTEDPKPLLGVARDLLYLVLRLVELVVRRRRHGHSLADRGIRVGPGGEAQDICEKKDWEALE